MVALDFMELAGHADLSMTQRYMHLSPAVLDAAIRLEDEPAGCLKAGPRSPEVPDHCRPWRWSGFAYRRTVMLA